ncbi:class I SAM-dependent methyltransferase [Methylomagnum sp.]
MSPFADLVIDLRRKLPFPDNFLELAYSEHVMEHVPYNVSVKFLGELHRTLTPGGTIRIAMPDLDDLVDGYQNDWRRSDWLSWPSFSHIETRCEMINLAFRGWGHSHLYNREKLARALKSAGFKEYQFMEWGQSKNPALAGL